MKWNKTAVLAVTFIFSASYIYSSVRYSQLSNKVEKEKLQVCAENALYDCELISQYHDECFDESYKANYRIREFHLGSYNACIDDQIKKHLGSD